VDSEAISRLPVVTLAVVYVESSSFDKIDKSLVLMSVSFIASPRR
jgi:hypothetical protein